MKVHKVEKVTKNNLTIISKPHAHPHTMTKTHAKFQKDRYKTVKRSCAHKTPRVNVDGWTNGRTETCTPKSPMLKQVRQKASILKSLNTAEKKNNNRLTEQFIHCSVSHKESKSVQ